MLTSPTYIDLDDEKTYVAKTSNGTVAKVGNVIVEESVDVNRKVTYSLDYLDKIIANLNNQLQMLNGEIADYVNLRKKIEVAAKTVVLISEK